jgi:hypothetical protein
MLKQLAAIGIGAALILAPVATFAQTAAPTPAATAAPMAKVVHHKAKAKHVVKKPVARKPVVHHKAKAMKPAPKPTETPKS